MRTHRRTMGAITAVLVGWGAVASIAPGAAAAPSTASAGTSAAEAPSVIELVPLTLPELMGVGEVGSLLSVTPPTWNLPAVETTVVWLRDNVAVPGSEGAWTYELTEADAGTAVAAQVTGTVLGLAAPVVLLTHALGVPVPGTEAATPSATVPPKILTSPEPKVGNQLTGTAPTWDTDGVVDTFQWLRNNLPIPGATGTTYALVADDLGKQVSLKVTGTKDGSAGTATSAPVLAPDRRRAGRRRRAVHLR